MHPKVLEIAETELRENESRKTQLLQQFRDWLEKHQFIISSKRDDTFLLAFLRLTKYNLDRACQRYEKTFLIFKNNPKYFLSTKESLDKCLEVVRSNYIYPLPGFDDEGCKIIVLRIGQRNPDLISVATAFEASSYIVSTLLSEHENQIAKYKIIFDFKNATMKNMLNAMENKLVLEVLKTAISFRVSKFIHLNLHPIVQGLVELIKMMASDKMRSRAVTLKNESEMGKHIQPISMLPTIYGGEKDEAEIAENFIKAMIDNRENYLQTANFKLAEDKIPKNKLSNDEYDNVGSFVKLEID